MREKFYIAQIIANLLCGKTSEEEIESLQKWQDLSPRNRLLCDRILEKENIREARRLLDKFEKQKGWDHISKELQISGKVIRSNKSFWNKTGKYAAIFIVGIASCFLFILKDNVQPQSLVPVAVHSDTVENKGIFLKLADGRTIDLKATHGQIKITEDQFLVTDQNGVLSYQNISQTDSLSVYNEIYVNRGEVYQLELSDGSRIYLNSMSRMKFPLVFGNAAREIELEGEAYLTVAHDPLHPFTVKTKDFNVLVLGTKFNVSAYPDDSKITTTLVEGAINVESFRYDVKARLKPNEQLQFDRLTQHQTIEKVDASNYISWIDGKLRFRDIPLRELMVVLQRWYDIEIEYETPEVSKLMFGCNFNRLDSIDQMIEVFEQTGKVKFLRNGKCLKISMPPLK